MIKGKSSKEFVGSDFDAYRNTFIGFIFQEYNVLDDFTVGANIGLALELQGKKATSEAIEGILSKVDLVGYAHRKPNELSGGQKQRVAIARALVKDPQIIMADEPTGALDSNTGKQIFDALKELSREKLVIIVSHDRDFAERYADRIIELSDGRIIEDVTKHNREAERLSAGVHRINNNILRIESGYQLTAEDLKMINAYLAQNAGDVLVSNDNRVNEELRSAVGISKEGASTVFEGTDATADIKTKEYDKSKTSFIRSRLPMKNAVKIGASGLKHKKFRLFMTILLSFISFAMFGLANSMAAYEKINAATESIIDSNIKSAAITLSVRQLEHMTDDGETRTYVGYQGGALNEQDIAYLEAQTGLDFVPVFTGYSSDNYGNDVGFSLQHLLTNYSSNTVYNARLGGLTTITPEQLATTGYQLTGRLPQAEGEIAITEFMYRQFNEYGFNNEKNKESVEAGKLTMDDSATGIIGKHITINQIGWNSLSERDRPNFKIVGVVNTNFDYDRYQSLMPKDETQPTGDDEQGLMDLFLTQEVAYERDYGFHALGFAVQSDIEALTSFMEVINGPSKEFGRYMDTDGYSLRLYVLRQAENAENLPDQLFDLYRVAKLDELDASLISWFESGKTTLGANEILISSERLNGLLPENAPVKFGATELAAFDAMGTAVFGDDWATAKAAAQANNCSYYTCLQYAEALAFIRATVPNMSDSDLENNFSTTDKAQAAALWAERWVTNNSPGSSVIINGNSINYYEAYEGNRSLDYSLFARTGVQDYILQFFGVQKPTIVKVDAIRDAANFLQGFGYGEGFQEDYTIGRWLSWIEELYEYNDAITKEVWKIEALKDSLLEEKYYGIEMTDWNTLTDEQKKELLISYYCDTYTDVKNETATHNSQQLDALRMQAFIKACGLSSEKLLEGIIFQICESEPGSGDKGNVLQTPAYKVVGTFDGSAIVNGDGNPTVICAELYDFYTTWAEEKRMEVGDKEGPTWVFERAEHDDGIWSFVIAAVNADNHDAIQKLVELSYAETEENKPELLFTLNNAVMYTLSSFNDIIETLSQVFMWVGLGLAVFSAFLLMNFISTSISYKKREIGILRAVGARSSDVFKIFFSEAFIIAIINFFLAVAASITAVLVLNWYMRSQGINITLLTFGPVQVALMLAISVAVAAIGAFLPVRAIARKKPVDAIKDR